MKTKSILKLGQRIHISFWDEGKTGAWMETEVSGIVTEREYLNGNLGKKKILVVELDPPGSKKYAKVEVELKK